MRKDPRSRDMVSVAGWLFADLLLGLAMLFFVFNTVGKAPVPVTPTRTPTPTTTPTATATATETSVPTPIHTLTPTPRPGGLEQRNVEVSIRANQIESKVRQEIREKLAEFEGKRAGMVLAFGTTSFDDPGQGTAWAEKIQTLLKDELPEMFEVAVTRAFHELSRQPGQYGLVTLWIFWIRE